MRRKDEVLLFCISLCCNVSRCSFLPTWKLRRLPCCFHLTYQANFLVQLSFSLREILINLQPPGAGDQNPIIHSVPRPPPGLGTQHLPEVSFLLYCSLFISFRFFSRNFIALCCILCIVLYCIGLIMTGKPAHKWFFHQIMMRTDVDVDVVRTDQGVDVRQGENHDLKKKILSHQER